MSSCSKYARNWIRFYFIEQKSFSDKFHCLPVSVIYHNSMNACTNIKTSRLKSKMSSFKIEFNTTYFGRRFTELKCFTMSGPSTSFPLIVIIVKFMVLKFQFLMDCFTSVLVLSR